jgi:hypothetical protein
MRILGLVLIAAAAAADASSAEEQPSEGWRLQQKQLRGTIPSGRGIKDSEVKEYPELEDLLVVVKDPSTRKRVEKVFENLIVYERAADNTKAEIIFENKLKVLEAQDANPDRTHHVLSLSAVCFVFGVMLVFGSRDSRANKEDSEELAAEVKTRIDRKTGIYGANYQSGRLSRRRSLSQISTPQHF